MKFDFVSRQLCLDFVGTLKWRRRAEPEEQFDSTAAVAEWPMQAGLLDAPMTISRAGLTSTIALREAVYTLVQQQMGRVLLDPDAVELVNQYARRPGLVVQLGPDGALRRSGSVPQLLATLARDVLELLGGSLIEQVKECDDPDCTRLFIDESRGRPRRWCGMAECGNRAKVEAFRRRQRAQP